MAADVEDGGSPLWRVVRAVALWLGLAGVIGAAVGFTAAVREDGGSIGLVGGLVLAALAGIAAMLGLLLWRSLRAQPGTASLSPRERRSRNILILCGLLGGIVSAVLMLVSDGLPRGELFSDGPIPAWAALLLIALFGMVLPVAAWAWHRNVDEQESAAYRIGALWGMYLYMIGVPVWWIGWRGGLLPAPDGIVIYFATIYTVGAVWLWKKYR